MQLLLQNPKIGSQRDERDEIGEKPTRAGGRTRNAEHKSPDESSRQTPTYHSIGGGPASRRVRTADNAGISRDSRSCAAIGKRAKEQKSKGPECMAPHLRLSTLATAVSAPFLTRGL
jgi:hypothetical protein